MEYQETHGFFKDIQGFLDSSQAGLPKTCLFVGEEGILHRGNGGCGEEL